MDQTLVSCLWGSCFIIEHVSLFALYSAMWFYICSKLSTGSEVFNTILLKTVAFIFLCAWSFVEVFQYSTNNLLIIVLMLLRDVFKLFIWFATVSLTTMTIFIKQYVQYLVEACFLRLWNLLFQMLPVFFSFQYII